MEEQNNLDVLHQAFEALNNKENKNRYFDLHDDSLVTHGIPANFPSNKEGLKMFYRELWQAFPDAIYNFEHTIIQGNEAACMFSLSGAQKGQFMGIPPSNKQVKIDGMIFFLFDAQKIVERWEIIDMLSIMKQLDVRQQLSAVKNAILEYTEVQTNKGLKEKIDSLFGKHLAGE